MPVPVTWSDISDTAASNSPASAESVGPNMNAYFQAAFAFCKQLYEGQQNPSAAVPMNGQKLTGLANGTAAGDAVNLSQLGAYFLLNGGSQTVVGATTFSSSVTVVNGLRVSLNGVAVANNQGAYLLWNEIGGTGATTLLNNQGLGSGGFVFRNVNQANTIETGRVAITATGDLTASGNITANSDERLKTDWHPVRDGFIDEVATAKSGTFTLISSGARQAGTSAQDWEKLLPETVMKDGDGIRSLAYGNAALVTAIELAKEVVALRKRVEALEQKS
jgi:hypothetical protein